MIYRYCKFPFFLCAVLFSFLSPANAQVINILDETGQTQSIVQLEPGGLGTVKVILAAEDRPQLDGVTVSLVKSANGKDGDIFDTTTTYDSGVATFFEVPPGTYRVKIGCDQLRIKDVTLKSKTPAPSATAHKDDAGIETINVLDSEDRSRALLDIELGGSATAEISVSSDVDASVKGINIQMVDLEGEKEKEVVARAVTDEKGFVTVSELVGGTYRVKLECPRYKLGGIQAGGPAVAGVVCPVLPGNITALLNALTIAAPAAPAAAGLGTAAAIGAAVAVPPIAVGIPAIVDNNKKPDELEPPITVENPPAIPPSTTPPPPTPPAPPPAPHVSGS